MKNAVCFFMGVSFALSGMATNSYGERLNADKVTVMEGQEWLRKVGHANLGSDTPENGDQVNVTDNFMNGVIYGAGQLFVSYVYNPLKKIADSGYEAASSVGSGLKEGAGYAVNGVKGVAGYAYEKAGDAAGYAYGKAGGAVNGVKGVAGYAYGKAGDAAGYVYGKAGDAASGVKGVAGHAYVKAGDAAGYVYGKAGGAMNGVKGVAGYAYGKAGGAVNGVKGVAGYAYGKAGDVAGYAYGKAGGAVNGVKGVAGYAYGKTGDAASGVKGVAGHAYGKASDAAGYVYGKAGDAASGVKGVAGHAYSKASDAADYVYGKAGDTASGMKGVGGIVYGKAGGAAGYAYSKVSGVMGEGYSFTAMHMSSLQTAMYNNPKMTLAIAAGTVAAFYGGWMLSSYWHGDNSGEDYAGLLRLITYDYVPSSENMKDSLLTCKIEMVYLGDKDGLAGGQIPLDHSKLIPLPKSLNECKQRLKDMPVVLRKKTLKSIDGSQTYHIDNGTDLVYLNVVDDYLSESDAEKKEVNNLYSGFGGQKTSLCAATNGVLHKVSVSDGSYHHDINSGAFIETIGSCDDLAGEFRTAREFNEAGDEGINVSNSMVKVYSGNQNLPVNDQTDDKKTLIDLGKMQNGQTCNVTTLTANGVEHKEVVSDQISFEVPQGVSYLSCRDSMGNKAADAYFQVDSNGLKHEQELQKYLSQQQAKSMHEE